MTRRLKVIIYVYVTIAFVVLIIYERNKLYNRKNNSDITEGILIEKGHSGKTYNYIKYKFYAQGIEYWGSVSIKFCNECKDNCCEIGTKVKVRYEKGNPENNDLVH